MRRIPYVQWMTGAVAAALLAGTCATVWAQEAEPAGAIEDFIAKSKQPVPWLKWGADARLRTVWGGNDITLNKDAPNHERHWQRYRLRLWTTITPVKDIDINARLVYEPRHFCKPDAVDTWQRSEALFDELNVVWRSPFGLPVTATVGRQNFKFGDGWLIYTGTPLSGSRTTYFDAIRLTWDIPDWKTTVDTIYINQKSQTDRHLPVFCDKDVRLTEQDERGFILYVTNKSLENTQLEGYYILKRDRDNRQIANSNDGDVHTFGGRAVHNFSEKLKGMAEFAQQVGDRNGRDVCAFGFNSRVDYFFKDRLNNRLRFGYEYASGDDPGTGTDEQFDRVWSRWWRLGDLITYFYIPETRYADVTNFHRIGGGWSCKPHEKLDFHVDYHLLFTDQNTLREQAGFTGDGCFRGQLWLAKLVYKFNKHVKGHVTGEFFCPGDYYDNTRNDFAMFLRYELVFTW